MTDDTRKVFTHRNRLDDLAIPDTWESCYEFGKWWFANNMPILVPHDYNVYCSDDATSLCLFRKGQFQVELYLIFPYPNLPVHEHPDVEVIKTRLNLYDLSLGKLVNQTETSPTLLNGEAHGAGSNFKPLKNVGVKNIGFPLVAIQKWADHLTPTTVASRWKGMAVGPKQEQLVRNEKPNAFIQDGYIDVTREMPND